MKLGKFLILALSVLALSCGGRPPPPPPPPPPPDPYPSRTEPFRWYMARGSSWFSGTSANPGQIVNQFKQLKAEWAPPLWPVVRTCAERSRWPDNHTYLFKGPPAAPYDKTSPAYKDLELFLKVAASIPRAQVLLVPICTLKENWSDAAILDGRAFNANEKWVRTVCKLAGTYENVAIEVINEWRHPNSIYAKLGHRQDQVVRMLKACRAEAPDTQIGTDTNVNRNRMDYDPAIEPFVDFLSFHPWRNPDPDEVELRAMVRQKIGAAVFSETTCFDFGAAAQGNCTGDWGQILSYQRDAERKGGVFFYHTKYRGLCHPRATCKAMEPITPRGDHEIKHGR